MKLHVSEDNTHVSAITFSGSSKVMFNFSSKQTIYKVSTALFGMEYEDTGGTHIDKALRKANTDLFKAEYGMRPNATKVSKYNIVISCYLSAPFFKR